MVVSANFTGIFAVRFIVFFRTVFFVRLLRKFHSLRNTVKAGIVSKNLFIS
jgi:hypothetical protein